MPTQLRWKPAFTTSCLHLADGLARGLAPVDPGLAEAIGEPAARLKSAIEATGAPPGRLWRQLAGLSGSNDSARQIAETALVKTIGRVERLEVVVGNLAGRIADLQTAVRGYLPNLIEELSLRERPIREQWEARGPGLLWQVANLTEEQLLVPEANVLLVQPAFGGAGQAHMSYNSARIEAVLANPHAELPEVVRLAWLVAQLQLDLPIHGENIHADRLPHVARLAMLPPVLRGAEGVELTRYSPELVRQAVAAWQIAVPPGIDVVAILEDWWETYQLGRPPFRVALEALDQMIA
ncbi:MAG: hypothetical protein WD872_14610 [Pirellulaceae bacterium]